MTKEEYIKENEYLSYEGIKEIVLEFENCENVIIPRNDIGVLIIKGFEDYFGRTAMNHIGMIKSANYFVLQIKDSGRKYHNGFFPKEEISLFERLSCRDIVAVTINYLWDYESYSWCVDYNEEVADVLGTPNMLETVKDINGDIWIAIGKDAQREFSKYILTDKKHNDSVWELWSIE